MKFVCLTVLCLVGHATVPDGAARSDVDQYIRTMTKLKPQWSDAKIRAAAQHQFAHVPGTIPMGARYTAPRFMSRAEIKSAIYAIASEHPGWRAERIRREFGMRYPNEPSQPSGNKIQKLLHYRSFEPVDSTGTKLMSSVVDKRRRSELARYVMKQAMATAPPDAERRGILKAASESFQKASGGAKMEFASWDMLYLQLAPKDDRRRTAPRDDKLTADQKRAIVYEIADGDPGLNPREIADEFVRLHPSEPDPPTKSSVRKYLRYRGLEPTGDGRGVEMASMGVQDKIKYSRLARAKVEEVAARDATTHWTDVVRVAMDEIHAEHKIVVRPETLHKWVPRRSLS